MAADQRRAEEIVHECPPSGSGLTPCCHRTPFEIPRTDRMTLDPNLVTCEGVPHDFAAHVEGYQ